VLCSKYCTGLCDGRRARSRAVERRYGRSERRKGGGDRDGVRAERVGLCAAASVLVVAAIRGVMKVEVAVAVEVEVEVEVEACRTGGVPRCASPGLVLLWPARICAGHQGWLLHTMQAGRGTECSRTQCSTHVGTQVAHTLFPQRSKQRDTAAAGRTSGRLNGAGTWGAGAQVEPSPTLHEGEARKALGSSPEQASRPKPSGGCFCPGPPGTSAPLHLAPNACRSRSSRRAKVYSLNYQSRALRTLSLAGRYEERTLGEACVHGQSTWVVRWCGWYSARQTA
jgi:hypothetical protein